MKQLLTTVLLLVFNMSFSQTLVFFEDFIDNSNAWPIENNAKYRTEIKSSVYYIVSQLDNSSIFIGKKIKFYKENYFKIVVKIKQVGGDLSDGYGIFVNGDNEGNGLFFIINSEQKFKIYLIKNGEEKVLKNWSAIRGIKPKPQYNFLTIEHKNEQCFFYINKVNVFSCPKPGLTGQRLGFVLENRNKIMVDFIEIFNLKPKINLVSKPITQEKENLGSAVNTGNSEIMPVISPDGKTLFFVRDEDGGGFGGNDIWYSQLTDTGWTQAKNIGRPLNNSSHNFIFSVSPDNNTVFLNGTYTAFGQPAGNGISFSHKQKDGSWSIPEKIKIENFYNLGKAQSFSMSPDQKVLVMTVKREDTRGGLDLYVSFKQADGVYSEPVNMGDSINSPYDEGTPFIAPDGQTLYFSSEGHPGYGDADIFVSHRLDDTWTNWSTPKNLGPYINSAGWDAYFSVDAKGEYAYLVSNDNSLGKEDIFRIKLQEEAKPQPVVLVYGNVYDKNTGKPLKAKVIYKDFETGEIYSSTLSNPATGEFKIVLPYGKKYLIYADKTNYFALSEIIDLSKIDTVYKEIQQNLFLVPFDKAENLVIKNISFAQASAELLPQSYPELDRIAEFLKRTPGIKIVITGYTNNLGDKQALITLSKKRANNVKNYLIAKGVPQNRIITQGKGPENPIAPNNTPEGRKLNQRVEIKIITQ